MKINIWKWIYVCKPLEADLRHFNYRVDKVIDWIIKVARMSKYKASRHNQNQFQFWILISVLKMSFKNKSWKQELKTRIENRNPKSV